MLLTWYNGAHVCVLLCSWKQASNSSCKTKSANVKSDLVFHSSSVRLSQTQTVKLGRVWYLFSLTWVWHVWQTVRTKRQSFYHHSIKYMYALIIYMCWQLLPVNYKLKFPTLHSTFMQENTRLSMSFQCSHMGISHHVVHVSAASHLPTCLDQYLLWTYTNHEIHDCACTLTLRCSMGRLPGSWSSSLAFSSILFSELTVGAAGTLLGTAPYWWPPGNVEYVVCGWVGWSSALLLKKPWGVFFIWSEDISTAC